MSVMRSLPWRRWIQVVLAILGVLVAIALILPAVQQAREAARRTQWRNNLKQLGLAFHNYHDSFLQFPPGGTYAASGRPHHGWTSFLMPFIDASPWYNSVDFRIPWDDPRQVERFLVFRGDYSPYKDPSVTTPFLRPDGLSQVHCAPNQWLVHRNHGVSISEITTGTSNTMLLADAFGHYEPFGHPSNWRDPTALLNSSPDEFGHPVRPYLHFLMADGRVDAVVIDADQTILSGMTGPESLRPDAERVSRLPWPYSLPPGGYWRTESLGQISDRDRPSLGLEIRFDEQSVAREVSRREYDNDGSRLDDVKNTAEAGPLDTLIPRLLAHPTLNRVRLNNSISDAGLSQLQSLPELHILSIGGRRITDRSLINLTRFPALEQLTIYRTKISDQGLGSTLHFPKLRRLKIFLDAESVITPSGMHAFQNTHPEVTVIVQSYRKRGEHNWYFHEWSACEIETLAAQGLDFDVSDQITDQFDCPADALRPLSSPRWFEW